MSQQRHATRLNRRENSRLLDSCSKAWSNVWAKLPKINRQWLGKFTRFQIITLSIAMCSIVLGVGTSLKPNQADNTSMLASVAYPASDTAHAGTALSLIESTGNNIEPAAASAGNNRKIIPLELNPLNRAKAEATATLALASLNQKRSGTMPNGIEQKNASPGKQLGIATRDADNLTATTNTNLQSRRVEKTIRKGDTLSEVFDSVGLSSSDVLAITRSGSEGKALATMYPGESLAFEFDQRNQLTLVSRDKSPIETIHFKPTGDTYSVERINRTPEIKRVHRNGIVEHSLSRAAEKAGLSASTTMHMANIFGGVMDFALDVRSGDRFTVIYEEHYLDGNKLKDGVIVAAQYVNNGTAFNAFRYENKNGEIGYYNEEGVSMRKAFLRAPLDFTRVSSSFNLKRLHPITKRVKPHRGIDYAAPRGTPVFSVGDGRVLTSGYSKANGKYVVIKHGDAYTTKYLHLHRRNVKRGQRVKQGQVIGQVGCTGLCTGPHLHYEFLAHGVHRNPRTIIKKLPKAKKLAKNELSAFTRSTDTTREILQHFSQQFELAALSPNT